MTATKAPPRSRNCRGHARHRRDGGEMAEVTCSIEGCEGAVDCRGWCRAHYRRWQRYDDPTFSPIQPPPPCAMDGCERLAHARGWCKKHYTRWFRYGDPTVDNTPRSRPCQVLDCTKVARSHGFCNLHRHRWQRYGDPLREHPTRMDRFVSILSVDEESGCWWLDCADDGKGYAQFWDGERTVKGYQWSYRTFVGPVPEGLELDHLCREHGCVCPEHLEAVTHTENVRRGIGRWSLDGRCAKGHLFDHYTGGQRKCSICMAEYRLAYQERQKKKRAA